MPTVEWCFTGMMRLTDARVISLRCGCNTLMTSVSYCVLVNVVEKLMPLILIIIKKYCLNCYVCCRLLFRVSHWFGLVWGAHR